MAPHANDTTTNGASVEVEDSFPDLPPFPSDIPTAPLLRLSLAQLRSSAAESDRLYSACSRLGFFYLDLRGDADGEALLKESEQLFGLGRRLFDNDEGEDLGKYDYSQMGSYMGYKGFAKAVVDGEGTLDRNEFYNASKDDFLNLSQPPLDHASVLQKQKPLLQSYMRHAHTLCMYILSHLESHLALPATTLTKLHDQQQPSGDHVRFIKSPPIPFPKPPSKSPSMGAHTDFGSVTILMNRLGGLQILPPTTMMEELGQGHLTKPEWVYVKPLPGHAVVNMGDAMVKFSSGLLRSNIHRVVTPPPPQDSSTRYSLVYFCRPCDDVPLVTIREGKIKEHLVKTGRDEVEEEVTAKDWIRDKAMSKRLGVPGGYRGKESFDPRRETAGEVLGEVVKAH